MRERERGVVCVRLVCVLKASNNFGAISMWWDRPGQLMGYDREINPHQFVRMFKVHFSLP